MRILVIPEITETILLHEEVFRLEDNIMKMMPDIKIANLYAWSVFSSTATEDAMAMLVAGYDSLSKMELFKAFELYIGYLHRDDFPEVDYIIYSTPAAKEIFEIRFKDDVLPKGREIIIRGDNTVENEVYRRAIIGNRG